MYKIQKTIWLTTILIGLSIASFSQNILVNNSTPLKTTNPINNIYSSYKFNNKIVILSDSRKAGDLDILITVLNKKKELLREQIIGTKASFDRPIELIQKDQGYWLLANSVKNGDRAFKIYELNESFEPIDYQSIEISNLVEVTAIKYDKGNQTILFTASVSDAQDNMYPRLIKYSLTQNAIIQSLDLNNRTDKVIAQPRKDSVPIIHKDENTGKIVVTGYKKIERFDPLSKECNQIECINNDCSEMVLVGQEISINFTDFWVAKIKDNSISWEKMYKTKKGGDVAMNVFLDKKSEQILVSGIGYSKLRKGNKDDYYHYNVLQLDKDGELLKQHTYKSKHERKTRCMYLEMKKIGNYYMALGDTQDIITVAKTFEANNEMTPANIYLVLLDNDGRLKTDKIIDTQTIDIPRSSVTISDNQMLLIFSKNEQLEILEITIVE